MKKRFLAVLTAAVLATVGFAGCGVDYGEEERSDVSYLYVDAYSGGFGTEYLEALKDAFEKENENVSFADGKKGVILNISSSASNTNDTFKTSIKSTPHDIHVVAELNYVDYLADNTLLDITDWVKEKSDNGKSIENKLYSDQISALTASEGKYYSLPTHAGFTGFTYNAEILEDNNLYFADDKTDADYPIENSSYTGKKYTGRGLVFSSKDTKSPGPDGKYGTYDDGLPSSYEEFFYWCDVMLSKSPRITPFIFRNSHYINYLSNALLNANLTKAEMVSNFTFNSGDDTNRIVTGFDGNGNAIIENVKITEENGYLINQQQGKYLMCKFMYRLLTGKYNGLSYYDSTCETAALSNTQVEQKYIESSLNSNETSIALFCEGNYWYNEARSIRAASVEQYKSKAENREFKYLPLPAKETGTVDENGGTSLTLTDNFANYLIVNGKVAKSEEKTKLAKAFVQFMYKEENLSKMTAASGIPFMLKYEMKAEEYNSMDIYEKSLWDAYKLAKDNDNFTSTISGSSIFQKHYDKFYMSTMSRFYTTKVGGVDYSTFHEAFWSNKANAETWFKGMAITKDEWTSKYTK